MKYKKQMFLTMTVSDARELLRRVKMYSMTCYGRVVPQSALAMKLVYVGKDAPMQVRFVDENSPKHIVYAEPKEKVLK